MYGEFGNHLSDIARFDSASERARAFGEVNSSLSDLNSDSVQLRDRAAAEHDSNASTHYKSTDEVKRILQNDLTSNRFMVNSRLNTDFSLNVNQASLFDLEPNNPHSGWSRNPKEGLSIQPSLIPSFLDNPVDLLESSGNAGRSHTIGNASLFDSVPVCHPSSTTLGIGSEMMDTDALNHQVHHHPSHSLQPTRPSNGDQSSFSHHHQHNQTPFPTNLMGSLMTAVDDLYIPSTTIGISNPRFINSGLKSSDHISHSNNNNNNSNSTPQNLFIQQKQQQTSSLSSMEKLDGTSSSNFSHQRFMSDCMTSTNDNLNIINYNNTNNNNNNIKVNDTISTTNNTNNIIQAKNLKNLQAFNQSHFHASNQLQQHNLTDHSGMSVHAQILGSTIITSSSSSSSMESNSPAIKGEDDSSRRNAKAFVGNGCDDKNLMTYGQNVSIHHGIHSQGSHQGVMSLPDNLSCNNNASLNFINHDNQNNQSNSSKNISSGTASTQRDGNFNTNSTPHGQQSGSSHNTLILVSSHQNNDKNNSFSQSKHENSNMSTTLTTIRQSFSQHDDDDNSKDDKMVNNTITNSTINTNDTSNSASRNTNKNSNEILSGLTITTNSNDKKYDSLLNATPHQYHNHHHLLGINSQTSLNGNDHSMLLTEGEHHHALHHHHNHLRSSSNDVINGVDSAIPRVSSFSSSTFDIGNSLPSLVYPPISSPTLKPMLPQADSDAAGQQNSSNLPINFFSQKDILPNRHFLDDGTDNENLLDSFHSGALPPCTDGLLLLTAGNNSANGVATASVADSRLLHHQHHQSNSHHLQIPLGGLHSFSNSPSPVKLSPLLQPQQQPSLQLNNSATAHHNHNDTQHHNHHNNHQQKQHQQLQQYSHNNQVSHLHHPYQQHSHQQNQQQNQQQQHSQQNQQYFHNNQISNLHHPYQQHQQLQQYPHNNQASHLHLYQQQQQQQLYLSNHSLPLSPTSHSSAQHQQQQPQLIHTTSIMPQGAIDALRPPPLTFPSGGRAGLNSSNSVHNSNSAVVSSSLNHHSHHQANMQLSSHSINSGGHHNITVNNNNSHTAIMNHHQYQQQQNVSPNHHHTMSHFSTAYGTVPSNSHFGSSSVAYNNQMQQSFISSHPQQQQQQQQHSMHLVHHQQMQQQQQQHMQHIMLPQMMHHHHPHMMHQQQHHQMTDSHTPLASTATVARRSRANNRNNNNNNNNSNNSGGNTPGASGSHPMMMYVQNKDGSYSAVPSPSVISQQQHFQQQQTSKSPGIINTHNQQIRPYSPSHHTQNQQQILTSNLSSPTNVVVSNGLGTMIPTMPSGMNSANVNIIAGATGSDLSSTPLANSSSRSFVSIRNVPFANLQSFLKRGTLISAAEALVVLQDELAETGLMSSSTSTAAVNPNRTQSVKVNWRTFAPLYARISRLAEAALSRNPSAVKPFFSLPSMSGLAPPPSRNEDYKLFDMENPLQAISDINDSCGGGEKDLGGGNFDNKNTAGNSSEGMILNEYKNEYPSIANNFSRMSDLKTVEDNYNNKINNFEIPFFMDKKTQNQENSAYSSSNTNVDPSSQLKLLINSLPQEKCEELTVSTVKEEESDTRLKHQSAISFSKNNIFFKHDVDLVNNKNKNNKIDDNAPVLPPLVQSPSISFPATSPSILAVSPDLPNSLSSSETPLDSSSPNVVSATANHAQEHANYSTSPPILPPHPDGANRVTLPVDIPSSPKFDLLCLETLPHIGNVLSIPYECPLPSLFDAMPTVDSAAYHVPPMFKPNPAAQHPFFRLKLPQQDEVFRVLFVDTISDASDNLHVLQVAQTRLNHYQKGAPVPSCMLHEVFPPAIAKPAALSRSIQSFTDPPPPVCFIARSSASFQGGGSNIYSLTTGAKIPEVASSSLDSTSNRRSLLDPDGPLSPTIASVSSDLLPLGRVVYTTVLYIDGKPVAKGSGPSSAKITKLLTDVGKQVKSVMMPKTIEMYQWKVIHFITTTIPPGSNGVDQSTSFIPQQACSFPFCVVTRRDDLLEKTLHIAYKQQALRRFFRLPRLLQLFVPLEIIKLLEAQASQREENCIAHVTEIIKERTSYLYVQSLEYHRLAQLQRHSSEASADPMSVTENECGPCESSPALISDVSRLQHTETEDVTPNKTLIASSVISLGEKPCQVVSENVKGNVSNAYPSVGSMSQSMISISASAEAAASGVLSKSNAVIISNSFYSSSRILPDVMTEPQQKHEDSVFVNCSIEGGLKRKKNYNENDSSSEVVEIKNEVGLIECENGDEICSSSNKAKRIMTM